MNKTMSIIHKLLVLFGFHNVADKHCNKDDVVLGMPGFPYTFMGINPPVRNSDFCPYQIWVQNFPYNLCHAQHQAVVACPLNAVECKIRREELAKHNGCPYYDESWGCSISPGKSCNGCSNKWKSNEK